MQTGTSLSSSPVVLASSSNVAYQQSTNQASKALIAPAFSSLTPSIQTKTVLSTSSAVHTSLSNDTRNQCTKFASAGLLAPAGLNLGNDMQTLTPIPTKPATLASSSNLTAKCSSKVRSGKCSESTIKKQTVSNSSPSPKLIPHPEKKIKSALTNDALSIVNSTDSHVPTVETSANNLPVTSAVSINLDIHDGFSSATNLPFSSHCKPTEMQLKRSPSSLPETLQYVPATYKVKTKKSYSSTLQTMPDVACEGQGASISMCARPVTNECLLYSPSKLPSDASAALNCTTPTKQISSIKETGICEAPSRPSKKRKFATAEVVAGTKSKSQGLAIASARAENYWKQYLKKDGFELFCTFHIPTEDILEESPGVFKLRSVISVMQNKFPNCYIKTTNSNRRPLVQQTNGMYERVTGQRQRPAPWLRCAAHCTQEQCKLHIRLLAFTFPSEGYLPIYLYAVGEIHEYHSPKKRLTGPQRHRLGLSLQSGVSGFSKYMEMCGELSASRLNRQADRVVPSIDVIRKAKAEIKLKEKLHRDPVFDAMLTACAVRLTDNRSKHFKGFDRSMDYSRKTFVFYNEVQLRAAKNVFSLYVDATGNIVLPGRNGEKYLLYVISAKYEDRPSVILACFVSKYHDSDTIKVFFEQFLRDYHALHRKAYRPSCIVTDFSFALMHSISLAWHHADLKWYLEEIYNGRIKDCYLTLCMLHVMKSFSRFAKPRYVDKKEAMSNFMKLCSRMIEATSLCELDKVFEQLCVMLLCEYMIPRAVKIVQDNNKYESMCSETMYETEMPLDHESPVSCNYRNGTPYGTHFHKIYKKIEESLSAEAHKSKIEHIKNDMYNKKILNYLLTHIMPFAPLWSAICQPMKTNGVVENTFKVLKQSYFPQAVSLSEFIVKAAQVCTVKAHMNLDDGDEHSVSSDAEMETAPVETWRKRNQRCQTYFSQKLTYKKYAKIRKSRLIAGEKLIAAYKASRRKVNMKDKQIKGSGKSAENSKTKREVVKNKRIKVQCKSIGKETTSKNATKQAQEEMPKLKRRLSSRRIESDDSEARKKRDRGLGIVMRLRNQGHHL